MTEEHSIRAVTECSKMRLPSVMETTPANLCRLLSLVSEFSYCRSDFGEAIGEAIEEVTIGSLGESAAEHLQNVLSETKGTEQTGEVGLRRTDRGREP